MMMNVPFGILFSVYRCTTREDGGNGDDASHQLLDASGRANTYTTSSVELAVVSPSRRKATTTQSRPTPTTTTTTSTATTAKTRRCSRCTAAVCVSALVLIVTGLGGAVPVRNRWRADRDDSSTVPTPRDYKSGWLKYHETLKVTAGEDGAAARVLLLGDSITEELLGTALGIAVPNWGSVTVWLEYYAYLGGVNLGVSGDQTQHLLWRLQNGELPEVLQPETILVAIGTNNLGHGMSAEDTVEGVNAVVQYVREHRPDALVCVMALFPRADPKNMKTPYPWPVIDEVNASLERKLKLGFGEEDVRFIDCTDRFLAEDGTGGRVLDEATMLPDNLHLTPEGLDAWADCAEATVHSGLRDD